MYSERTTITGFFVDSDEGQLALSVPAADLYDAAKSSEVLLSWQTTDDYNNIITKFSRLVSSSRSPLDVTEDVSYTFVFDNGETYANDGNVYAERTSGDTDVPADPQSGGGSGGGVLEVTVDWDTADGTLDKTWQEIADAPMAIYKDNGYTYFCVFAKQMGVQYGVIFASVNTANMSWENLTLFVASSASGYPEFQSGD